MRKMLWFVAVLLAGCLNDSGLSTSVVVKKDGSNLLIENQSSSEIHYAVFERQGLALINWAPICSQGNQIQPGKTQAIPLTDESFRPSNQAVVFWWERCVKDSNSGAQIGEDLKSVIVTIR